MSHAIVGGWDRADVVAAQHALVMRELASDAEIGPYAAFRWAMGIINLEYRKSLLDAGCGVGHYGVLCDRFYPRVQYHGTDLSWPDDRASSVACAVGTILGAGIP